MGPTSPLRVICISSQPTGFNNGISFLPAVWARSKVANLSYFITSYKSKQPEHGVELVTKMLSAWKLARKSVKKAQKKQKRYFDRNLHFRMGTEFFFSSLERDWGQ